ncbi:MAG: radical SAM protein [Deltaproteobacteria bacterium]|nr:radical SAM protein [Deltaproteobacteria bacterium]
MRIKLIDPALKQSHMKHSRKEVQELWFPRLSLPIIAALTPPEHAVTITDETVEPLDINDRPDLVGIGAMSTYIPRAYEIADDYRKRGVPVVIGGIHASLMPEEALQHADAVVVGEAENLWGRVLADAEAGKMKGIYKSDRPAEMDRVPMPRLDLLRRDRYMTANSLQTTRGCPFSCDFCSVTEFFGNTYRFRPVGQVVAEVRRLKEDFNAKFIAFVDDNIVGNPKYAKELFRALIPLKIKWGSQGSLTMAKDDELLDLAAKSGCVSMFVGIESISEASLKAANKKINKVADYEKSIAKIHDHGIMINAGFIFGFDTDDEGVFERTVRFVQKNRLTLPTYHILTPLPGTHLFHRLKEEGRIFDFNWANYNSGNAVFTPRLMSPETLQEGYFWAFHETYTLSSIAQRVFHPQPRLFQRTALNLAYRRIVRRSPEGNLSPFSEIFNRIPEIIPSREKISTAIELSTRGARETTNRIVDFLKIQICKIGTEPIFQFDLQGVLDRVSARKLWKKSRMALNRGAEMVVINFQEVRAVTPNALKILLFRTRRIRKFHQKIRLINIDPNYVDAVRKITGFQVYARERR